MVDAPVFYLYLYRKIKKKSNRFFVGHSSVMEILKRFLPYTPRVFYYSIIKDLEKFKLIKKMDKTKYEITGGNLDNHLNRLGFPI